MTDIVERLREVQCETEYDAATCDLAAARIEQLEAALREIAGLGVVCASDIAVVALRDARAALGGEHD